MSGETLDLAQRLKAHECSQIVFGERVQHWPCTRKGVIEHGGKWYCRQHDPEAVAVRRAATDARWTAKTEAMHSSRQEAQRERLLLTAQLERLTQEKAEAIGLGLRAMDEAIDRADAAERALLRMTEMHAVEEEDATQWRHEEEKERLRAEAAEARVAALTAALEEMAVRYRMASDRLSERTGNRALDRERQGSVEAYMQAARDIAAALSPAPQDTETTDERETRTLLPKERDPNV